MEIGEVGGTVLLMVVIASQLLMVVVASQLLMAVLALAIHVDEVVVVVL